MSIDKKETYILDRDGRMIPISAINGSTTTEKAAREAAPEYIALIDFMKKNPDAQPSEFFLGGATWAEARHAEALREARLEGVVIQRQIELAKRAIKNGDPGLAAFTLRDLAISKEIGIDSLFACLASENGFPHENDVNPLIERIQAHLSKTVKEHP